MCATGLLPITTTQQEMPWPWDPFYYIFDHGTWWGAAGLCARVRACAGATAESLHTYTHTYGGGGGPSGTRGAVGWRGNPPGLALVPCACVCVLFVL